MYNPHDGWDAELISSLNALKEEMNNLAAEQRGIKKEKTKNTPQSDGELTQMRLKEIDYSVFIINDGSTKNLCLDKIQDIQKSYTNLFFHNIEINTGKGNAVRTGVRIANSDYYIYTDFDFPFGYECIAQTYSLLKHSKFNLIIGKRDKSYFKKLPLERKIISKALMYFNFMLSGFKVSDTQAGLKGIDNIAKDVLLKTKVNGFIFEKEFIGKCLKQKLGYSLIPIKTRENIKFS